MENFDAIGEINSEMNTEAKITQITNESITKSSPKIRINLPSRSKSQDNILST